MEPLFLSYSQNPQPALWHQPNNATLSLFMKDWLISFATELDPNNKSYSETNKPIWSQYKLENVVIDVNYGLMGV